MLKIVRQFGMYDNLPPRPFSSGFQRSSSTGAKMTSSESLNQQREQLPLVRTLRESPEWVEFPLRTKPGERFHFTLHCLHRPEAFLLHPLFFQRLDKSETVMVNWIGNEMCGFKGLVHGGLFGILLDDCGVITSAANFPSHNCFTATMTINYKRICPINQFIITRAAISKLEGRKCFIATKILDQEEKLVAEATALYLEPKDSKNLVKIVQDKM
ncbi:uncharacterized protein VTP21DRAFT_10219 [Calcarisporiella thermophila]|uniref:uncharacterized protein n=1 Tax=Calcarisporiella thermophila TaxID=911321 RepID=UPI00374367E4